MTMRIQELSQRTAVPAKTIRYYESIELMPDPRRAANNYRQYTPEAVERLHLLSVLVVLGSAWPTLGNS